MPSFVDHLGAASSPALGTPRRVRHVPEQISVERKFVEKYMALYLYYYIQRIKIYIEERRTSQRTSRIIPAISRWYTGVSLDSLDTAFS